MKKTYLLPISLVAALALAGQGCFQAQTYANINSFSQCVDAGYVILESDPRQCRTPDGRTFTEEQAMPPEDTTPPTSASWAEPNGIAISDQKPGDEVLVSAVIIEEPGWIVIHKEENGAPGAIIGQTYINAGEYSGIRVRVSEPMQDGMGYYAMLHTDTGSSEFDVATDTPVRSQVLDGAIMARFVADADAGDVPIILP